MKHSEYVRIGKDSAGAVLMIHGILGSPRHFDRFLDAIDETWSVYNILLDGHGKTVEDFSETSMEKWKKQVDHKLWELCARHKKVVVIAHSLGALLAVDAVARHHRVIGMVLLGMPLVVRVKPGMSVLGVRYALGVTDEQDPVAVTVRQVTAVAPEKYLWRYLKTLPRFWELLQMCHKIRDKIPQISVPTYVFQSRQDELVSIKSCKYLQENPNVSVEILERSGHFLYSQGDMETICNCITALLQ